MSSEISQQKLQNLLEYETHEYMTRQGYQKPFDRINPSFFAVHVISSLAKFCATSTFWTTRLRMSTT